MKNVIRLVCCVLCNASNSGYITVNKNYKAEWSIKFQNVITVSLEDRAKIPWDTILFTNFLLIAQIITWPIHNKHMFDVLPSLTQCNSILNWHCADFIVTSQFTFKHDYNIGPAFNYSHLICQLYLCPSDKHTF